MSDIRVHELTPRLTTFPAPNTDESFICGTGAEIQAVGSIDGYTVGDGGVGPIVSALEQLFHDIVRGRNERFNDMSTEVY